MNSKQKTELLKNQVMTFTFFKKIHDFDFTQASYKNMFYWTGLLGYLVEKSSHARVSRYILMDTFKRLRVKHAFNRHCNGDLPQIYQLVEQVELAEIL